MRTLLLLLLLILPALAQEPNLLVLPPVLRGDYLPLSSQQFTQVFTGEVHKLNPKAGIVVPREQDLAGMGYRPADQPPALEQARQLCASYQATHVCYLSIRFRPELTAATGTEPGILAMAGAARLWVFSLELGKVVVDEPISVVRSGLLPKGTKLEQLERDLGNRCAHDLAQQIVTIGQQRAHAARVQGWKQAPPQAAAPAGYSANVKRMFTSIDNYRNAVDSGDLIATTDGQRAALSAWRGLSRPEQAQVEKRYPGTLQWMEGGVYYDLGGYWRR